MSLRIFLEINHLQFEHLFFTGNMIIPIIRHVQFEISSLSSDNYAIPDICHIRFEILIFQPKLTSSQNNVMSDLKNLLFQLKVPYFHYIILFQIP